MITVDSFLIKLLTNFPAEAENIFQQRDIKLLKSLANGISGPLFITENQSKLLVKILKEYQAKLEKVDKDTPLVLADPLWSKSFRTIEQVRKLYIQHKHDHAPVLVIEFTFSAQVRKSLETLAKSIEGLAKGHSGKVYFATLTEHNIVTLVNVLTPFNFNIDEEVLSHYNIIKSWDEKSVKDQFLITTMTNHNFHRHITNDLGISTEIDQNIINDRSKRYQYFVDNLATTPTTLAEVIANRHGPRIWIDSNQYSLSQVIQTLVDLKRLPVLVVFDNYNPQNIAKSFKDLTLALDENHIFSNVGIYFRLSNDATGKEFNESIAARQYNSQLDEHTKVVGVQNGKIPKFFLTSSWKPLSVISLGTNLRHSKTAVFANNSDLIVTYSDTQPLVETRFSWE